MIISILWFWFYIIFMIIAICVLPLYLLLRMIVPHKWNRWLILGLGSFWGRVTVSSTFSSIRVTGKEYLPTSDNICFVCNHQGFFDIPILLGYVPKPMGFIAKFELSKVPILSQWMKAIHCVFIDRKNSRKTIASFNKASSIIRTGNPVVIFPEGTRSRGPRIASFHAGSTKLALMAKAIIVPIAIDGSWRMYEDRKRIRRAVVQVSIMPMIMPDDVLMHDTNTLSDQLHSIISNQLNEIRKTN